MAKLGEIVGRLTMEVHVFTYAGKTDPGIWKATCKRAVGEKNPRVELGVACFNQLFLSRF